MKVPRWTFGHLHSTKPSFLQTSPSRLLFHQPLVHPRPRSPLPLPVYSRSSSSSTRWKARQSRDSFASRARLQDLKSRAAFKLLELNEKHRIFRSGNTVVDLGYAPGSWSQIAVNRTQPNGRVVGIDVIPAQPPKGVSTIQGNFLSPEVQAEVRRYVLDPARGRARKRRVLSRTAEHEEDMATEEDLEQEGMAYIDLERRAQLEGSDDALEGKEAQHGADRAEKKMTTRQRDDAEGRVVDVVLSDMSEPWSPPAGLWKNSLSNPYFRMMNTSGLAVRDHAGSMDLCMAALTFCYDALRTGGHFVCKFYQGSEDKDLEKRMKQLFDKVHREKPEASRSESKEAYFVALRRKADVERERVLGNEE